jgi:hypothetical protein
MSTSEPLAARRAPRPPELWNAERHNARPATSARPTVDELLAEADDLVAFVPVAGPPVVFVLAPWMLLVLILAGPFAVLVAFVLMCFAATVLVGLTGAIVASPYLLVRHLRGYRTRRASRRARSESVVAIKSLPAAS